MRKMTKKSKVLAAAGALALVAGGGGAAFAYWTTTGSGDGTAINSAGGGKVTLHATFDAGLAPGDSVTVAYTADNADLTTSTRVGELTAYVTTSDDGCDAAWFTVSSVTSNSLVAASSTGTSVGSGTLAFADVDTNQDLCKSATITVHVSSL